MSRVERAASRNSLSSQVIRSGFAALPSAGMRVAPEVLLLEAMRYAFGLQNHGKEQHPLNPDRRGVPPRERAVLYAFRGRENKKSHYDENTPRFFFAPAYPCLASKGWFRSNEAPVVSSFLFGGAVAQFFYDAEGHCPGWTDGITRLSLAKAVQGAMWGNRACGPDSLPPWEGKDIFSIALQPPCAGETGQNDEDRLWTADELANRMAARQGQCLRLDGGDELARRVTRDLKAVCDLEAAVPRAQWLQMMMTFLAFALPIWMLAQMRVMTLLHGWLLAAADGGGVPTAKDMSVALRRRNRSLLCPRMVPNRDLYAQIDAYVKGRIEVGILLEALAEVSPNAIKAGDVLVNAPGRTVPSGGPREVEAGALLAATMRARDRILALGDGTRHADMASFLASEAERSTKWNKPRGAGNGKNIDEFLRVLYGEDEDDDAGKNPNGHLLIPEGRGRTRGFRVFPGLLLMKLAAYLAGYEKASGGKGGDLALQDIEELFGQYGVDFSSSADTRPMLMGKLQAMGLLTGSPDAGSSVTVAQPFPMPDARHEK